MILERLSRLIAYRRPLIVAIHMLLVGAAYLFAFFLRFEFRPSSDQWALFLSTAPLLLLVRTAVFAYWRLHEGLWRYVSMRDILTILRAVTLSSLVFGVAVMLTIGPGFPRSILVLDWLVCLALVGGVRLTLRAIRETTRRSGQPADRRALIVGAGDAGEMLAREIGRNSSMSLAVAGFVDDDPKKRGRRLHGIEVVGTVDELPGLSRALGVDEVLIATPSVVGPARRRIVERCLECGLPFKTVPGMHDLLVGKARIAELEEVRLEDLLGREAVKLDSERLRRELTGRRILVTGAAGSIGSELCRQVATFEPDMLVLLDRAESGLYFIDLELRQEHPRLKIASVVGDIRDLRHVSEIMHAHAVELVYHAAAYKHVPLIEAHPLEGIVNNVIGTETMLSAALQNGVKKFVLISSDKAVNPVGIMGMTKRIAECLLLTHGDGPTSLMAVRFGNVLGSDGSVVPLFRRQLARGGPLTVTDLEASRYFMLPSEAVQLVLQAGAIGHGGEVFFLDMGEPVRILELAHNLVRLSGLEPGKDIPIDVIGLRPGERLREELFMNIEDLSPTEHPKILMVRTDSFVRDAFLSDLETLRHLVTIRDRERAVAQLKRMAGRY